MAKAPPLSTGADSRPIDRLLRPFHLFALIEAGGGILLLACAAIALIWANSRWAESYESFWHTYLSVGFGDHTLKLSLAHFVNDGLMAIFFFVVGLEIKRELIAGELASPRKAAIPIAAAVGGMAAPALVFVVFNVGEPGIRGWAIPAATDIAFAIGIMAMLGKRVPVSLKVFLTALAIVDDLGAVVIIALFYTTDINLLTLVLAAGMLVLSLVANLLGIRRPLVYALIGIIMWVLLLKSGIHATIGGVLLALTIPSKMRIRGAHFTLLARQMIDRFEQAGGNEDDIMTNAERQVAVHGLEEACEQVQAPLGRLEHRLHPWVAFVVMPVFALANAGVPISSGIGTALTGGVGLGVALGLVIGKPVGVMLTTFLAIKLGLGSLPEGTSWKQILAAGFLAGIGFTMSLFIANLAFPGADDLQAAKYGILTGSIVSGIAGFVLLRLFSKPPPSEGAAG